MWKNKKPMLLISTHASSIQVPCQFPLIMVPQHGAMSIDIPTSLVFHEYTKDMQRIDIADQLKEP